MAISNTGTPTQQASIEQARQAIEKGESYFSVAADHLADARAQGMSQREMARALNKSVGWVNVLLRWRETGAQGSPFGPQSKAARNRRRDVHARERKLPHDLTNEARAEIARAEAAKADAARAKAEARKAKAEAAQARAEARAARDRLKLFEREVFGRIFAPTSNELDLHTRALLVKALGMLGSDQPGEIANAASLVEKLRRQLGVTWEELIVPAMRQRARAA